MLLCKYNFTARNTLQYNVRNFCIHNVFVKTTTLRANAHAMRENAMKRIGMADLPQVTELFTRFAMSKQVDDALLQFERIEKLQNETEEIIITNDMMQRYTRTALLTGDIDVVFKCAKLREKMGYPTTSSLAIFEVAIELCCKHYFIEKAFQLYEIMTENKMVPKISTYSKIIHHLCEIEQFHFASRFLKDLRANHNDSMECSQVMEELEAKEYLEKISKYSN